MFVQRNSWKRRILPIFAVFFLTAGGIWYVKEYTTVGNSVNGHEMPVCSVETEEKKAALTFETAWGEDGTAEIMELLKEKKVRATFFVTADWMDGHPDLIGKMKEDGHDVGTMGVSHDNLSEKSAAEIQKELQEAKQAAKKAEINLELFRPPYGRYSDTLIRTAWEEGFFTVCWSVDSKDWKEYGAKSIVKEVLQSEELQNGAIIRLNSESRDTKEALGLLIDTMESEGWQFVPVSELILREGYHMDVKGRQIPRMT